MNMQSMTVQCRIGKGAAGQRWRRAKGVVSRSLTVMLMVMMRNVGATTLFLGIPNSQAAAAILPPANAPEPHHFQVPSQPR